MKKIIFREDGEKARLCDLLPGTLFEHDGCIALKSEYQTSRGLIEAAIVDSGEQFWGGAKTVQEQRELLVQPFELTGDEEALTMDAVEVVRCNWVPVSERLPEGMGYVLTVKNRHYGVWPNSYVRCYSFMFTHWMPLPEPPKEDDHET